MPAPIIWCAATRPPGISTGGRSPAGPSPPRSINGRPRLGLDLSFAGTAGKPARGPMVEHLKQSRGSGKMSRFSTFTTVAALMATTATGLGTPASAATRHHHHRHHYYGRTAYYHHGCRYSNRGTGLIAGGAVGG